METPERLAELVALILEFRLLLEEQTEEDDIEGLDNLVFLDGTLAHLGPALAIIDDDRYENLVEKYRPLNPHTWWG